MKMGEMFGTKPTPKKCMYMWQNLKTRFDFDRVFSVDSANSYMI